MVPTEGGPKLFQRSKILDVSLKHWKGRMGGGGLGGEPPPLSTSYGCSNTSLPPTLSYRGLEPPCVTFCRGAVSLQGPGQSPVLPFACCVGSLRSVGRCGQCSCWCRCRVRGAQWLAYWRCAGQRMAHFSVFAANSPPHSGRPPPASLSFRGHVVHRVAVSSQGPGRSPPPPPPPTRKASRLPVCAPIAECKPATRAHCR